MPDNGFIRTLWDVKVPMRDDVRLSADVFLPPQGQKESYPAILVRTPYATEAHHVAMAQFFAANGYAYIIQDTRGRLDSEGVPRSYPIFNEGPDGFDTIEWLANQSWCNGNIGMMGGSYRAWVQWAAAREHPPHLKTMVSTAVADYTFIAMGLPSLEILKLLHVVGGRTDQTASLFAVDWERVFYHLPLKTMDEAFGRLSIDWKEWIAHPHLDDYWKPLLFTKTDFEGINLPILHITGWYDNCLPCALPLYEGMVNYSPASKQQYLLIGPWDHAGTRIPTQILQGVDFSLAALMDMKKPHLEWFDYWLKDKENALTNWKRTKYFMMGENKWVEEDSTWPSSANAYQPYHLHSNGRANTLLGDGRLNLEGPEKEESSDSYIYNPEDPVVVVMDFMGQVETPLDNRFILRRDDVLVYSSEPLEKRLLISGRPVVELYASSDCVDTDWFATLGYVYPDGRSIPLGTKGLRARCRNSFETPELMVPGQVYKFTIEMDATCIVIKPGHKIRLAITSSAFPVYARNQNTGNDISEDTELKIATNTIYHDKNHPSCLLLPIK